MDIHQGQFLGGDHSLLLPAIILFGTLFMVWYLRREQATASRIILMQVALGISGLLGAKVFSLYVRDWQLFTPASLELQVGLRYPGALIAFVLFAPLLRRWIIPAIPTLRYLDAMVLVFGLEAALWRLSCYLNGCCVGGLCNEFYCLAYGPGTQVFNLQQQAGLIGTDALHSLPVLPLHLLLMIASFATIGFLLWLNRFKHYDGQIILLYLFLHEAFKGLLELLREPYLPQLQTSSLMVSLAAALVLVGIFYWRRYPARQANR